MGWGLSSGAGEPSGLWRFKIGIKQYYFGFRASSWLVGGGWEAQAQRTVEKVQHSSIFFPINRPYSGLTECGDPK